MRSQQVLSNFARTGRVTSLRTIICAAPLITCIYNDAPPLRRRKNKGRTVPILLPIQPRTQAQLTKNRHTTVFLYRSVAKMSERAGILGEDAGNEAPGRICNKHGGHEDANVEIAVLFAK